MGKGCPHCACLLSSVTHTWKYERKWRGRVISSVRRRRVCTNCKLPRFTVELDESEYLPGVPQVPEPADQSTPPDFFDL